MDPKAAKRMERFAQFAVAATKEALEMSGIDMEKEDPYRVGVSVGSGIGSLQALEREHKKLLEKGPGRVNLLVPMMISNMAAGNVGIQFGLKGKCINVVTACVLQEPTPSERRFRSIQYGEVECDGGRRCRSQRITNRCGGFTALTALTTSDDPLRASIPFDKDRSGFVMGEGAGVVILEELEHALSRNAVIYGEVVGYGLPVMHTILPLMQRTEVVLREP